MTGIISSWVKREYFPREAIVRCVSETRVSLEWFASGEGYMRDGMNQTIQSCIQLESFKLEHGMLSSNGFYFKVKTVLNLEINHPFVVQKEIDIWGLEKNIVGVDDCYWLFIKNGFYSIYYIVNSLNDFCLILGALWPKRIIKFSGIGYHKRKFS